MNAEKCNNTILNEVEVAFDMKKVKEQVKLQFLQGLMKPEML